MYFQLHGKQTCCEPAWAREERHGERGKGSLGNESLERNGDTERENHVEKLSVISLRDRCSQRQRWSSSVTSCWRNLSFSRQIYFKKSQNFVPFFLCMGFGMFLNNHVKALACRLLLSQWLSIWLRAHREKPHSSLLITLGLEGLCNGKADVSVRQ